MSYCSTGLGWRFQCSLLWNQFDNSYKLSAWVGLDTGQLDMVHRGHSCSTSPRHSQLQTIVCHSTTQKEMKIATNKKQISKDTLKPHHYVTLKTACKCPEWWCIFIVRIIVYTCIYYIARCLYYWGDEVCLYFCTHMFQELRDSHAKFLLQVSD